MAAKIETSQTTIPFPRQEVANSLLAFQFDTKGRPVVIAEFRDDKEKLALLCFAQLVLSQLGRELGENAVRSLHATVAA